MKDVRTVLVCDKCRKDIIKGECEVMSILITPSEAMEFHICRPCIAEARKRHVEAHPGSHPEHFGWNVPKPVEEQPT